MDPNRLPALSVAPPPEEAAPVSTAAWLEEAALHDRLGRRVERLRSAAAALGLVTLFLLVGLLLAAQAGSEPASSTAGRLVVAVVFAVTVGVAYAAEDQARRLRALVSVAAVQQVEAEFSELDEDQGDAAAVDGEAAV